MDITPRLNFCASDIEDDELNISCQSNGSVSFSEPTGISIPACKEQLTSSSPIACSPPYKRVRALRLFDSPATPKTLMEKSTAQTPILPPRCTKLIHMEKPRAVASCFPSKSEKPAANVNPFTPTGMQLNARKRTRSKRNLNSSPELRATSLDTSDLENLDVEVEQPTKRVALHESNIPRYHQEFLELELIGIGEFGSVYKCINRLDGCTYAVKKSIKPITGSVNEKNALNEVYAHAVLGKHPHVVRYYSAWAEDDHMVIQNEYCNGGSLADSISKLQASNAMMSEAELRQLLLHIAEGLKYLHSSQLVHMDIKPGNIFISKEKRLHSVDYDSADDGFDEEETVEEEITYKIGDLGHVTSITNPLIEEGDCRYLPTEILHEDLTHMPKADIFALGLTVYEAGGGGELPKNGPQWHEIRDGKLKDLPQYSRDFNELLKLMIHPNPEMRPSATSLIQHRVLYPYGNQTKAQLRRELNAEKLKNEILAKQVEEANKCLKTLAPNVVALNATMNLGGYGLRPTPTRTSARAIGKKVNRSYSATNI
ncbi:wee1-like protein kinase isoform X2 [Athalia rosae]|uniref:wee1-like protein kinase isoform X2 n=1 Tax=Athalia rosae TaxID=37344 RepID=UPI0006260D78|nr:wee1-like protein kinase isoform X2 [Athalia rosae]